MATVLPHETAQSDASQVALIRQFCLDYFAALGAPYYFEGSILVAELDEAQASFLVGAMSKPLKLRLVFTQSDFAQNPDVELIIPGSFRLNQMIDSVVKRGSLTRQFGYTAPERVGSVSVSFTPYLFMICQLSYMSPIHHLERWIEIACNLVDGTIILDPYQYLVSLYRSSEPPAGAVLEKRRISYKQAFFTYIGNYLVEELSREDPQWAVDTHKHLRAETEEIKQYFSQLIKTAERNQRGHEHGKEQQPSDPIAPLLQEQDLRLKEITQRYTPQVIIRPITAAIIYLSSQAQIQFQKIKH